MLLLTDHGKLWKHITVLGQINDRCRLSRETPEHLLANCDELIRKRIICPSASKESDTWVLQNNQMPERLLCAHGIFAVLGTIPDPTLYHENRLGLSAVALRFTQHAGICLLLTIFNSTWWDSTIDLIDPSAENVSFISLSLSFIYLLSKFLSGRQDFSALGKIFFSPKWWFLGLAWFSLVWHSFP